MPSSTLPRVNRAEPVFVPGESYPSIFFSGAAFFLPFHFGCVKCLLDNNVSFDTAYGVSSGAQAALAMLGGSDLHLGLRQCDDLSSQLKFFTWNYMSSLYGKYFEKYRSRNHASLEELRRRLHVGLFDIKSCNAFFTNEFHTEEDLRDIISASGNIVPFMGIMPRVYKDMWLVDGIAVYNVSPEHSPVTLAVTPFDFSRHLPESSNYVCGSAMLSPLACFYTDREMMDNLFIEGYQKVNCLIVKSVPRSVSRNKADLALLIDCIKREQQHWKKKTGFVEADVSRNMWDEFIVKDHGAVFLCIALVLVVIKVSTPIHFVLFSLLSPFVAPFDIVKMEHFYLLMGTVYIWVAVRKGWREVHASPTQNCYDWVLPKTKKRK
jgi:hypothetical protein|eukprot:Stramenopile-MAST_4_protein_907